MKLWISCRPVSAAFIKSIIPDEDTPSASGMLLGNLSVVCPESCDRKADIRRNRVAI
jgi:hypothetical protein